MELYDEKISEKKSKIPMIIGICVAVLVVITIILIFGIFYLKSSMTVVQIDGIVKNEIEENFYLETTEQGTELYIPIIKISEFLGYEGFNGDYKNKSEDKNKCHVVCEEETAMFTLDSDMLIKITKDSEYEYVKIDKPVFEKDGELYTTIDGIQKAFNVAISVNENYKDIKIYSMDYLVQYYATALKLEEDTYSTNFNDKKAILENMIVIMDQNKKYGVINAQTGKSILEMKYDQVDYLPATTDFLVKSNGKYGVVTKDAKTKIKTTYNEIKAIDYQNGLYMVKQNNSYGVIDTEGNIIIEPEYKQIGININKYSENGIENAYVLLDEIIPIQNNDDLWGLFNIKGEKIADFQYTEIGCQEAPASNLYPAAIIPSYKVIVVQKDEYYNLITIEGEELITGYILDSVYLKINAGTEQNQFFMTSNGNTKVINVEEWLASTGR